MKIELFYYLNTLCNEAVIDVSTYYYTDTPSCMNYRIFLKSETVAIPDCEMPTDEEIRSGLIANLHDEKRRINAETHMKLKDIDDKIRQLLCIENTGA